MDNDETEVSAWDLEDFLRNPVILFAHMSFIPPIGISIDTFKRTGAGELVEFWRFNDLTEVGREVHALFELGDMRAASVGFIVRAFHRPGEDELKKLRKKFPRANEWSFIVDEAELVETSAVPVPADPGALAVEGRTLEDDLADVYAELGIRGVEGQVFHLGSLATETAALHLAANAPTETDVPDRFPEVRAYWDAAKRFIVAECERGNAAACTCLPREVNVTTPNEETLAERDAQITTHLGEQIEPAPDAAQVAELIRSVIELVQTADNARELYRQALHLAADNDATLVDLGRGDGGAAFDLILAEARFRVGVGSDPLVERDEDEEIEIDESEGLTSLDGLEVEIEE